MPNLSELTFAWPWLIIALPAVWLVWWWLPPGTVQAPRVPFADTWQAASLDNATVRLLSPRRLMMMLVWALLVAALMRPQVPGDTSGVVLSGGQMMLLVDLSLSMSIQDMTTSNGRATDRLTAVKGILNEFIPQREGDQMGLIVFGSQAYVHVPVTPDLQMVQQLSNEMEIGMAGSRTALGEALALGVLHLTETDTAEGDQVMILLSDGAQTIGNVFPPEASVLARDNNIRIYSIGFGSDGGGSGGSSADLDEPALRMLAESTGGQYFRARTIRDLNSIYQSIDALEPTEFNQRYVRHARDLFYWPAGIALVLLLAMGNAFPGGPLRQLPWQRLVPSRFQRGQTDDEAN